MVRGVDENVFFSGWVGGGEAIVIARLWLVVLGGGDGDGVGGL